VLYLPALSNGFAYDDVALIQLDERVHSLANVPAFFTQGYWADAELALYRPLTTLSFAIDWAVSGGDPAWFLFTNAVWNAVACILVFLLLLRFTGLAAAFGGALLFAVHPVHVEAVANVVGRAELGAAAFMVGSLLLWPMRSQPQRRRVAAIAVLFTLALLTKESAIMLPALLVLLDAARGDLRPVSAREWAHDRAGPLLLLAGIALAYLAVRAVVLGGIAPARVDAALEVTSGVDRIATALQAWPVFVRLLVMPVVLLADYGPRVLMPAVTPTPAAIAGALILPALVLGGIHAWWRGRGVAALALLWFPVTILPVSNLIIPIGVIVAERTLYLPSFALALAVSLLAQRLSLRPTPRLAGAGALTIFVALFAARTVTRIPDWRSTDTIFAALLRDRPDSFRAHWHHARRYTAAGQHARAIEGYAHAFRLWPYRRRLVLETTRAAIRAGNLTYARDVARFAHSRWPADADAARLYAAATLDLGDTTAARGIIVGALRTIPGDSLLLRMQDAVSDRVDR
jgi:tetratricopeptide (TPR) repeat protein